MFCSQYDMIPQMMATHWAISGDADHFTEKNMPTALMPGLLFLLLISMMLWLTRNTVQSYINTVTGANYLISLFISLLSAITAYSVVNGEAFPVVIAYPALFVKKRTGTGLTVNTGRPVGRVVVVLFLLLIGLLALYMTLFY